MFRPGVVVVIAMLAVVHPSAAALDGQGSWTTFGNGPERQGLASSTLDASTLQASFYLPLDGRITSQVLAARDVFSPGSTTLYAATSEGRVYAVSERGYVLWSQDVGQLAHACPQLDGYGITGTGVVDPSTHALYVADSFGRLHAFDLRTGAERPGWPVRVVGASTREQVWGALVLVGGRVYVPTGSYCDVGPMQGHAYSVDLSSRTVRSWAPVPEDLGGGGGIWGWGGIAYSAQRDSLFVVTGNALEGGSNSGSSFRETAGLGEHLVELSRDLDVRAASTTPEPGPGPDADLVGSPVLFTRPGCGEVVVAARKDGELFGWRTADVSDGPLWHVQLERFDPSNPVLAQPAYDAAHHAVVVVTGSRIARVDVTADCAAHVAWSRPLDTSTENGLPTIAGGTIWVPLSGAWPLAAIDTATGAIRARFPLTEPTLTAPTIIDGRLVVGSFAGALHGFASAGAPALDVGPTAAGVRGHLSKASNALEWVSREDGVFATDDGGRSWRRFFAEPAITVVRTSRNAGVIVVGAQPPKCGCHARVLWTADDGKSWHATTALSPRLTGRRGRLYWLDDAGRRIFRVDEWPPHGGRIRSRVSIQVRAGRIADFAAVPGGVAALVTARVDGHGWDDRPTVVLSRNARTSTLRLPSSPGQVLVRSLSASWPSIVVHGANFDVDGAIVPLVWRSRDGGATWTLHRGG